MQNQRAFSRFSRTLRVVGAAVALSGASILPAVAQGFGGFQMPPQINEMLTKARQSRAFADPGISNTSNLLTRPDVRNELFLNGRQTEALADMQDGYGMAIGAQMIQMVQKVMAESGGANPQDMTAEDRQAFAEQIRSKAQDTMFAVQAEQDKKAESVLNAAQLKRLHELDMQWRGPLALNEAAVSEKFNLTPEQKTKLTALLKEFRDQQQASRGGMMGAFGGPRGLGGPAAGGKKDANSAKETGAAKDASGAKPEAGAQEQGNAAPPTPGGFGGRFKMPTPEEMQTQMDEASKQTLKLRKTMDAKVLALLTPEQQQQWKLVQGKLFAFRITL